MSKAYLVGAGPGDPRLLTIAAVEVLQCADVILCDRLVSKEIVAKANARAKIVYVGKGPGDQERVQTKIFELFRRYAGRGLTLVRLKGGDPYVFGRGSEEHDYLTSLGYEVSIVPGITSALGVPAMAGIPMTARGISASFAVITGHRCDDNIINWFSFVSIDTLVVLMGVSERISIARHLIEAGRPASEPVAFIENGSCVNQRIVRSTLGDVSRGLVNVSSPAVFVIGKVSALHDQLDQASEPWLQELSA
ncbi:MAG TPA: uroporphyrinogen-III C-methyltransferase [Chroococcales cyanobacterium]